MAYGTVKVDNVTFTYNAVDATTTFSGFYASTTNNLTLSGTASAATFTGTTANFTNANVQNISVTTLLSGLAITGGTAGFTSVTGTTVTGTTANFVTLSGTTVTGTTAQFTSITGGTAGFTTVTGTTVTGTTANFVTLSGTTVTGVTITATTGIFSNLIFANTTVSGDLNVLGSGTFASGVIISGTLSGATITGTTAQFTSITGGTAGFTTVTGTTVTGTTANFVTLSGTTTTFTSGIIASGTALLPSLAILSDPNTGIFSPGADQLAISTSGVARVVVNNTGLGIGVPPGRSIDVYRGDAGQAILRLSDVDSRNVEFRSPDGTGTQASIGTVTNHDFISFTGNTERLRLSSTGEFMFKGAGATPGTDKAVSFNGSAPVNSLVITSGGLVGLGTSSPSSLLHLSVASAAVDGTKGVRIANPAGTIAIFECGSSDDSYIGTTSGSAFSIRTNNTSAISIDASQRVGIGTTGPQANLHIQAATGASLRIQAGSTSSAQIDLIPGGAVDPYYIYVSSSRNLIIQDNASERARIDSSGRLLVGTSNSDGAPSSGAIIQLANQFSVRAVSGGGVTNQHASTASATTLNCVIDVSISSNIYSSFIGSLYICQQLTSSEKSFLAEYRVKIYNTGGTAIFTLVDSVDDSSPNNVALTFAYSNGNRQITVTSTWTTATPSAINCTLIGAGATA